MDSCWSRWEFDSPGQSALTASLSLVNSTTKSWCLGSPADLPWLSLINSPSPLGSHPPKETISYDLKHSAPSRRPTNTVQEDVDFPGKAWNHQWSWLQGWSLSSSLSHLWFILDPSGKQGPLEKPMPAMQVRFILKVSSKVHTLRFFPKCKGWRMWPVSGICTESSHCPLRLPPQYRCG